MKAYKLDNRAGSLWESVAIPCLSQTTKDENRTKNEQTKENSEKQSVSDEPFYFLLAS